MAVSNRVKTGSCQLSYTIRDLDLPHLVAKGERHGLWTPNEGINQRNLKFWADVADLKIWDWELIFGRAVKVIASPGVCGLLREGCKFYFQFLIILIWRVILKIKVELSLPNILCRHTNIGNLNLLNDRLWV